MENRFWHAALAQVRMTRGMTAPKESTGAKESARAEEVRNVSKEPTFLSQDGHGWAPSNLIQLCTRTQEFQGPPYILLYEGLPYNLSFISKIHRNMCLSLSHSLSLRFLFPLFPLFPLSLSLTLSLLLQALSLSNAGIVCFDKL